MDENRALHVSQLIASAIGAIILSDLIGCLLCV